MKMKYHIFLIVGAVAFLAFIHFSGVVGAQVATSTISDYDKAETTIEKLDIINEKLNLIDARFNDVLSISDLDKRLRNLYLYLRYK